MAQERLSMRKIREIFRLKWECGLSFRQIAASLNVGRKTVSNYIRKGEALGIRCGRDVQELTDQQLENQFFPTSANPVERVINRPQLNWSDVYEELRAHQSLTLMQVWREYKDQHPEGYEYSQFAHYYKTYKKKLGVTMRQDHKPGDKLFVDYCDGLDIIDKATGKNIKTHLFVAVWGASNYTYAEASLSQNLSCWTMSHVHAFDYFKCVPRIVVPDNLKSGVSKACRYEPDINPTYQSMASYYGVAVIPARPRKPRDKAKAEAGVLVAQRWILAALRHHQFFSLAELNKAIAGLLEILNTRLMKKMKKSRQELFKQWDQGNARTLPTARWEYTEWLKARVNIDYHIEVKDHYYSVPYRLVHEKVDVLLTASVVEILYKGKRIASHPRSFVKYKHTTHKDHRPISHQKYAQWSPSRLINWAGQTGPHTAQLIKKILVNFQNKDFVLL